MRGSRAPRCKRRSRCHRSKRVCERNPPTGGAASSTNNTLPQWGPSNNRLFPEVIHCIRVLEVKTEGEEIDFPLDIVDFFKGLNYGRSEGPEHFEVWLDKQCQVIPYHEGEDLGELLQQVPQLRHKHWYSCSHNPHVLG